MTFVPAAPLWCWPVPLVKNRRSPPVVVNVRELFLVYPKSLLIGDTIIIHQQVLWNYTTIYILQNSRRALFICGFCNVLFNHLNLPFRIPIVLYARILDNSISAFKISFALDVSWTEGFSCDDTGQSYFSKEESENMYDKSEKWSLCIPLTRTLPNTRLSFIDPGQLSMWAGIFLLSSVITNHVRLKLWYIPK